MKKLNLAGTFMIAAAITGLLITGCKKDESPSSITTTGTTDFTAEETTNASDGNRMAVETDDVADEANSLCLNYPRFRGFNYQGIIIGTFVPCNATVDTSMINVGKLTVTYNGLNCDGTRMRSGSIVLQLPYSSTTGLVTPWNQSGCLLAITYNSYKVTLISNNKLWTFNGTKYITNVNGGLVDNSTTFITPLVHNITGMLQITFDDNTTRSWNIDRTRTFARNDNITNVTTVGNATENGYPNVSEWGINRAGNTFSICITTPVVSSSLCNYNNIRGVRMHYGVVRDLTITYGVDATGNPVTSGCPYGYKLNWINQNGVTKEVIIAY